MPIKCVVIVRLKVSIIFSQSDDLHLFSSSQLRLKVDTFLTCSLIVVLVQVNTLKSNTRKSKFFFFKFPDQSCSLYDEFYNG